MIDCASARAFLLLLTCLSRSLSNVETEELGPDLLKNLEWTTEGPEIKLKKKMFFKQSVIEQVLKNKINLSS